MTKRLVTFVCAVLALLSACVDDSSTQSDELPVTLIFTNDIESAYEPVTAFWLDDIERIGGIAQLATLIDKERSDKERVFLFDSGDIFTGALSTVTHGELMFEFMISMDYDAMVLGNHEFDYGEEVLRWQKSRVPFPVLAANLFYKGTDIPFAQPHAVIERDGIRIGVIGVLGQDAASSAIAPAHIDLLDVTSPVDAVRNSVAALREQVDLIVLLTHQGHTAPMQTDAEIDPRLQRDIQADIDLANAVPGVDVLFGGHADAGTWEPVVAERTGTLIMQTYGQGTYLGRLQLLLDRETKRIVDYSGELLPVNADNLAPAPVIAKKIDQYRAAHPALTEVLGRAEADFPRRYFDESDIGNLFADILVEVTGADIGMMHPGGIRKDLAAGDITTESLLDMLPFVNPVVTVRIDGTELREIVEQSLSLERGLMQLSGLTLTFDTSKPVGSRIVSLRHDGREVTDQDVFSVAVSRFIAGGGDLYDTFENAPVLEEFGSLSDMVADYFRRTGVVVTPTRERQRDISASAN